MYNRADLPKHKKLLYEKQRLLIYLLCDLMPQDIGDVSGDHKFGMGNCHHGVMTTHGDQQKNHVGKYLPAILGQKFTKCKFQYCNQEVKWVKEGQFHGVKTEIARKSFLRWLFC